MEDLIENLYQEAIRKITYEVDQAKLRGVKSVNVGLPFANEKIVDRIEKLLSETKGIVYNRNKLSFEIDWSSSGDILDDNQNTNDQNQSELHLRDRIWQSPFQMMEDLIQGVANCYAKYWFERNHTER